MRAFAAAVSVVALAALGLWAGGAWMQRRVDAERARDELAARLEQALALPVELGAADLCLLPRPTLRVRDVRIGAPGGPRLLAAALRVDVAQLALLHGRVEPRAFELDGATLEAAGVRLEQIAGSGSLEDPPVFEFSAVSPRFGPVEGGRFVVSERAGGVASWRWSASGRLAEVDLARLAREAELGGLRGLAAGAFDADGVGADVARASIELESDLDLQGDGYIIAGRVKLAADAAGAVALDLGAARLQVGARFEKPAGVPLRIAGAWEEPRPALRLRDAKIESDALRAAARIDFRGAVLELAAGELDLAALYAESLPEWLPRAGRVHIESARLDPSGAQARGELEIAGEKIAARVGYDAARARIAVLVSAEGARIEPLAEALWGRGDVSGRLYAHIEVEGPLERRALTGVGDFELLDGEWPGFSLARAAGLEYTFDEPPGLDRFESIAGTFELADDRLEVQDLAILQEFTAAAVKGRFYLDDRTADLTGMVRFDHPDLPGPSLRPILRMAGSLDALETHISDARSEDVQKMEAAMLEIIRKVEAKRRGEKPAPHAAAPPQSAGG